MTIVNVTGVGRIKFPDTMSQAEIAQVIDRDFNKREAPVQADQPGILGQGLIGLGSGVTRLGQGAKQLGLLAGENLGLLDQGTTKNYTRDVQQERALYDQTPVANSAAGILGQIAPEIVAALAVPGGMTGGLLRRMGTGALAGGGIMGAQFVPEDGSRLENVAAGAALGGAAPAVVSGIKAGYGLLSRGKNAAINAVAPETQTAKEIRDLGDKFGVPVLGADVGNPTAAKIGSVLEQVPFSGQTDLRLTQNTQSKVAAEKLVDKAKNEMDLTEFGGSGGLARLQEVAATPGKRQHAAQELLDKIENSGDDWNKIIQNSGNVGLLQKKLIADKLYDAVAKLARGAGRIALTNTNKAINSGLNFLNKNPVLDKETMSLVSSIKSRLTQEIDEIPGSKIVDASGNPLVPGVEATTKAKQLTFNELREFRSALGNKIEDYYTGKNTAIGKTGAKTLQKIKNAIEKDMESFATKKSGAMKEAWRKADRYYKKELVPFKDVQLAKALKTADADTIYGTFIKSSGGLHSKPTRFYNALDEKGKAAVRYGMVKNALEDALNPSGSGVIFSPAKFDSSLNKISGAKEVFYSGQAKKELEGFQRLMRATQRSGQVAENPATGNRLITASILGGTAVGTLINPSFLATAATAGALSYGLQRLLNSNVGRKALRDAATGKENTRLSKDGMERAGRLLRGAILERMGQESEEESGLLTN